MEMKRTCAIINEKNKISKNKPQRIHTNTHIRFTVRSFIHVYQLHSKRSVRCILTGSANAQHNTTIFKQFYRCCNQISYSYCSEPFWRSVCLLFVLLWIRSRLVNVWGNGSVFLNIRVRTVNIIIFKNSKQIHPKRFEQSVAFCKQVCIHF